MCLKHRLLSCTEFHCLATLFDSPPYYNFNHNPHDTFLEPCQAETGLKNLGRTTKWPSPRQISSSNISLLNKYLLARLHLLLEATRITSGASLLLKVRACLSSTLNLSSRQRMMCLSLCTGWI